MKKKKIIKEGLDPIDCRMIGLLQKDGRMSNTAMGHVLGISEYTVRKRLKRILDSGIIRITAVGSPLDLGFEISGNLKIRIDLKKTGEVVRELMKIDELIWIALTTGGTDIDVDFAVRSMKELQELIFNKISHVDGVLSTETSLMVELIKEKSSIGTAWD
jgi:Lrp/AsnC family transcriptional regulator, regulator for asnA, asnC and gidA